MSRFAVAVALVLALGVRPGGAYAQDPSNDTPGANDFPDASVGQGGADKTSQESEDSSSTCVYASDCERGFACQKGRCVYVRYRDAKFLGCGGLDAGGAAWAAVGALGLATLWRARRRRRSAVGRSEPFGAGLA